ncbi:alpha/beta hydrolase family protein [Chitinispirillum alkaliphilum]|nr:alpha/beta hydrolase family protein [Chitinispirillum alkaliphilum]
MRGKNHHIWPSNSAILLNRLIGWFPFPGTNTKQFPFHIVNLLLFLLLSQFFVCTTDPTNPQNDQLKFTGPIEPIREGFGARGPFQIETKKTPSPLWKERNVQLFIPNHSPPEEGFPVVFFAHGYGQSDPSVYASIIDHMVSHGAAVVFSPYRRIIHIPGKGGNYELIYSGFREAVRVWGERFDLSRVGFVGHSFGGGTLPWVAYNSITQEGWGRDCAFMFIMAPWYFYEITEEQLRNFPSHVKMVMQVYKDDQVNDPAIAAELFNTIALPDSSKVFMMVHSDTGLQADKSEYIYRADHHLPKNSIDKRASYDAYLYYAVLRQLHALFSYTMNACADGASVIFGPPTTTQQFMGHWPDGRGVKPLEIIENPVFDKYSLQFLFPWSSILNPRRDTGLLDM